ncbi:YkyA family protein [Acinetobacter sp. SH20PTE14]|uniref:YkyA family protein n=1 Tax=Acinetobacter sp. SH20PTE14 TaxID=2905879 RepID=UPI001F396A3D|nr:YkyA family protein [Acinetobacter sp. SH20PTE14]UIJ76945.1 YkyA family protein [Acinetobacter sp. SH20PTE14]UIJ77008.1 YkyA family protein [Acinetobacter sp. SH20PTE14]
MPDPNEERLKYLFNAAAIEVLKVEEGQKRKFKGTAYAGGRVDGHWYWGRSGVVFDLDGIEIDKPAALLEEHFSSSRIGVVQTVDTNGKIDVSGDFLTNAKAQEIVQDSDDGFPFQMSMMIDPGSIEEVSQGKTVTVNGQVFEGPITIFRQNRIREFTICSTGADRNTSIKAFSGKANPNPTKEDTDVTELEKEKAAREKAEQERDAAQAELKKFKADKREEDIKSLETAMNKQFSAEEKKSYTDMDDAAFAFMAQQLKQFSAGNQQPAGQQQQTQPTPGVNPAFAHLFTHQANGGQGGQQTNQNDTHKFTSGAQAFAQQKGK